MKTSAYLLDQVDARLREIHERAKVAQTYSEKYQEDELKEIQALAFEAVGALSWARHELRPWWKRWFA